MNYSSGVYSDPEDDLEAAQVNKMDRIAERLELGPDDHLLEIGTGWGGLAVHLAGRTGCRITTTTISKEQAALARQRVEEAGLTDRIEVLETDYRDLTGTYDRLVSVEMIEAVGWRDFPTYFSKCSSLLKPGGAMLLQAIVIDDDAYELEKASRSFISHFIFPGGCLPSVAEISRCLESGTDMRTVWVDGHRRRLRPDPGRLARPLHSRPPTGSRTSVTTCASGACGCSTCASPRAVSGPAGTATCRCCWRSRDSPRPLPVRLRRGPCP